MKEMRVVTFESGSKQEGATSREWRRDSGTRQCERGFEGWGDSLQPHGLQHTRVP